MRLLSLRDERGSAPVEFALVSVLVVALVLGVVQLALALHVRNTVQDAAAEGARWAALADNSFEDGRNRAAELISFAVGDQYAQAIELRNVAWRGRSAVEVTVRAALPLVGLLGPSQALTVTAHATREVLP